MLVGAGINCLKQSGKLLEILRSFNQDNGSG
jgi:hypothetical protein